VGEGFSFFSIEQADTHLMAFFLRFGPGDLGLHMTIISLLVRLAINVFYAVPFEREAFGGHS